MCSNDVAFTLPGTDLVPDWQEWTRLYVCLISLMVDLYAPYALRPSLVIVAATTDVASYTTVDVILFILSV